MTNVILVVTGDHDWTLQAVHLAAAMARETGAAIALIEMVAVNRVDLLGDSLEESPLPYARLEALGEYAAAIDGYGIAVAVATFAYSDYVGGLLSAAEQNDAQAVFAPAPGGSPAFLAAWRGWYLRRALRRPLYSLAGDAAAWQPRAVGLDTPRPSQVSITSHS